AVSHAHVVLDAIGGQTLAAAELAAVGGIGDAVQLVRRHWVRLAHDRRAVERPAVDADLQRSDADPVVALVVLHAEAGDDTLDGGLGVVARADADGDAGAERQPPLRLQLLIVPEALGVAAPLAYARDADLVVPLHQSRQAVQILRLGDLGLRYV